MKKLWMLMLVVPLFVFGGTVDMTNDTVLVATPTADNHAATKKYVDDNTGGGSINAVTTNDTRVLDFSGSAGIKVPIATDTNNPVTLSQLNSSNAVTIAAATNAAKAYVDGKGFMDELSDDLSPTLGGNLEAALWNITGVGYFEGKSIYSGFATMVIDLENRVLTNGAWYITDNADSGTKIVNYRTLTNYVATHGGGGAGTQTPATSDWDIAGFTISGANKIIATNALAAQYIQGGGHAFNVIGVDEQRLYDVSGNGWYISHKINVSNIYDGGGATIAIDVDNHRLEGAWSIGANMNANGKAVTNVNYITVTNYVTLPLGKFISWRGAGYTNDMTTVSNRMYIYHRSSSGVVTNYSPLD